MNCRVNADFPTPPLPTMITLWRTREVWFLFLPEAMALVHVGPEAHRSGPGPDGSTRMRNTRNQKQDVGSRLWI